MSGDHAAPGASIAELSAFHDHELAATEAQRVAAHARECTACASVLQAFAQIDAAASATRSGATRGLSFGLATFTLLVLLLVGSGIAVGAAVIAQVRSAASEQVSLEQARRESGLPLPSRSTLPGGWTLRETQFTRTEAFRSVNLQYARSGALTLGVTVWSRGMNVVPTSEREELDTVAGVAVTRSYTNSLVTARFEVENALILVSGSERDVTTDQLRAVVSAIVAEWR